MIDAHHHVWRVARGDYGWLTPDLPICRDYTLDDLRPLLGPVSGPITGTVLVQAAPTAEETRFLLEAARGSAGLVRGVVGWADLEAGTLALPDDPLLAGIRPMLHDLPDPAWVLRPAVLRNLARLRDRGLAFDALVRPVHLPVLAGLARAIPDLRLVIDHAAKPAIAAGGFDAWAGGLEALARVPGWHCKLSGLPTEAGPDWTPSRLRPYVEHALRRFGAGRVMFGSDWPVVDLAGGYTRWFEAAWALVPADDRAEVFGGTAARFYRLSPPAA